MRVLHVLDHSLPLHSGYSFRTAAILREQRALGWQTEQLTTPRHGRATQDVDEAEGWRFHRTPLAPNALSRLPGVVYLQEMQATARRIAEVAQGFQPDIVHAHSPVLAALPALWAGRRLGIPVVYEVRALWEDAAVDHGTTREGSVRYRLSKAMETWLLRRVDAVTVICQGLKDDLLSRGIAESRITVIPNAVDVADFPLIGAADVGLQQQLGLAGATVLGFIGSFYGYEGLDTLLDAMPVILRSHSQARVLLVGGGYEEQRLKAQAARLGIADKVVFTGRVPHAEVQRYYSLVDLLVYPRKSMRLTNTVTPLKPLEAMAQGRLLAASDVGGHRELIQHERTGFLFRPDDPADLAATVLRVLSTPAAWPAVRAAGRQFVESERTWQNSVSRYRGVYSGLLGRQV